jgi:Cysteine rich repeat
MKKNRLLLLTTLAVGSVASAQDTLLDYVAQSCRADMDKFCANVTPGEGRLINCAAAYRDQLSDECKGAIVNAAIIVEDVTYRALNVAQACETELDSWCGDVEVGEGRVLACLNDHADELSKDCDEAVDDLADD